MARNVRLVRSVLALALATVVAVPVAASASTAPTLRTGPVNTFAVYRTPFHDSVEPSLGVVLKTGDALFTSGGGTRVAQFDDRVKPATATFSTAAALSTAPTSLDPIGFVDQRTGRSFDSELAGACSFASYSDDEGKTSTTSQGCGLGTLLDHQTLGAGPYVPGGVVGPLTDYPDATYYCAQDSATSTCGRSDDGGQTFGPGVEIGILAGACSALTGHLKVSATGVVAVANKDCGGNLTREQATDGFFDGGHPAANVSEDNGLTWTARFVPGGSSQDEDDDSVAFSRSGKVLYLAWQDGANVSAAVGASTSTAKLVSSRDNGVTWSTPVDISTPLGLHNVHFPEVVSGDDDRVAVQFLGTAAKGDDQQSPFTGAWQQYIAMSYDGGKTFTTTSLTPGDPVQRGCVDLQGTKPGASNDPPLGSTVCTQRELYDFQDLSVDALGRPVGVFTDACTGTCVTSAKAGPNDTQGVIERLQKGKGLYAQYDTVLSGVKPVVAPVPVTKPGTKVTPTQASGTGKKSLPTTGASRQLSEVAALLLAVALGLSVLARRRSS